MSSAVPRSMSAATSNSTAGALSFFCTCPRGLEGALSEELKELAARFTINVHQSVPGGVHVSGNWITAFAINLHSRIASRALLRIAHGRYTKESDIFDLVLQQRWENWFTARHTLRVDVTAIKSPLRSIEFITLKIKDAVCDRLRDKTGARPSVDTQFPDVRVQGFLDATHATIYLDTSGEALFKRGWRKATGDAPLRENLAAGLLRLAKWSPGQVLYDPFCGSGTIIIEAAQSALGIAPGVNRKFGFEKLQGVPLTDWQTMKAVAVDQLHQPQSADLGIYGSDISGDMLTMARENARDAHIQIALPFKQVDARFVKPPQALAEGQSGIMLSNPPYDERIALRGGTGGGAADAQHRGRRSAKDILADDDEVWGLKPEAIEAARAAESTEQPGFYAEFSSTLKGQFAGWQVYLFTADLQVPKALRLKESMRTPLFNGAIECRLFRFEMVKGGNRPAN